MRALVRLVKTELPATILRLEADLGLPPGSIPTPAPEDVHGAWVDVVSLGRFPTIMVVQEDTETRNTGRQLEATGTSDEYAWRYPVRLLVHNMGVDYGLTELDRKRLLLAVRTLLLQHRVIIGPGHEQAVIEPETLREVFSGGAVGEAQKLLLESYTRFEVSTVEHVPVLGGDLGTVAFEQAEGVMPHPGAE